MIAIAQSVAATGTFGNPFPEADTGPTGVVAPLYPFVLSLLIRWFGDSASVAGMFMAVLVAGLNAALMPVVSSVIFGRPTAGTWGALLFVLLPAIKIMPGWEAWTTSAALMGFCLICYARRNVLLRGICVGLLGLLNPVSALVAVVLLVMLDIQERPVRRVLLHVVTVAALGYATCVPWMLRNARLVGSVSVKNNFGMTLLASNNNCAQTSLADSVLVGCYQAHHPAGSLTELSTLKRLGEGEYDRYSTSRAFSWIAEHFSAFFALTLRRTVEFWFPPVSYHVYAYSVWGITALSAVGAWLLRGRRSLFLVLAAVLYSAPYCIVVSDIRYRYPVLWISLLLGGVAVEHLLSHTVANKRQNG